MNGFIKIRVGAVVLVRNQHWRGSTEVVRKAPSHVVDIGRAELAVEGLGRS